jgi:SAM-dependent methyltransferase
MLLERALPGTHELVLELARRYAHSSGSALELGAGSGALAERLQGAGFRVLAADTDDDAFRGKTEFVRLDLDAHDFHQSLCTTYDVITSVEVIEHLQSPIAFLTSIRSLLKEDGVAIITTPNVENLPARLKFLWGGKIRAVDAAAPEHITPIFYDLFVRQYLPKAGLRLVAYQVHPKNDYPLTGRRWVVPFFLAGARLMRQPRLRGDCHVFILKHKG